MKKSLLSAGLYVISALMLVTGTVFAESIPSAKSAVAVTDLEAMSQTNSWETLEGLSSLIKIAEQKDMSVDVSLECGLSTRTNVKSKGGNKDSSTAEANVKIRVRITDEYGNVIYAQPAGADGVVFCKRTQTLSATFQGIIEKCIDAEGHIDINDTCLEYEEVELILDTMNANAFNFLSSDLTSGTYAVEVQADIDTCTGTRDPETGTCLSGEADADAIATIGLGSMVVDEIRMIK